MNAPQSFARRARALFVFGLAFICLPILSAQAATAHFASPSTAVEQIFSSIDTRLALMPEVAATKWRAHQPISDAAREREVLDHTVVAATNLGLDPITARHFFDVQIRMARAIEEHCFARWTRDAHDVPVARDLKTELRPRLDSIGRDLLLAVYLGRAELTNSDARAALNSGVQALRSHEGLNESLLRELYDSIIALRSSATIDLHLIKHAGVLRVGSTGDYAPFSIEKNGELRGVDIDLATSLAKHLGVQVRFIRTTWSRLMEDFQQQRFDIAMSGITNTPERSAQAAFSVAYHQGGKTPIARCADQHKFTSLQQIDQSQVRVLVNPGGTNEWFVRQHLKAAHIVMHEDNRTIFDALLAGDADVMITDSIEADLQVATHARLCRTTQNNFTHDQKAILLPRHSDLRAAIDSWLAPQLAHGEVQEKFRRAIEVTH